MRAYDAGHEETDAVLSALEKKLKRTYRAASRNATEKFEKYMADFVRKDAAHIADVNEGRWSQEEYDNWRRNQLLYAGTLNEIRDTIAKDLQNTDKIAIQMVRDKQVDVYAINHNYGTYEVEHGAGVDTSYSLYDHDTVERLMRDDPALLPKPSARRQREIDASDLKWNKEKLTSAFTASILSGDSIPTMAKRISSVAAMDANAAIRNARTMTTGAECAGRSNAYARAKAMGIDIEQEWMATLDGVTRDSHRAIDGEKIPIGGKFSNGLRFPGDPEGAAREVYNCRCTTVAVIDGIDPGAFDKSDVLQRSTGNFDLSYEEWKRGHRRRATADFDLNKTTLKMTDEEGKRLGDYVNALPKNERDKWIDAFSNIQYEYDVLDPDLPAYNLYDDRTGTSIVHLHPEEDALTVVHETAHAIDRGAVNVTMYPGKSYSYVITSASRYLEELRGTNASADIESICNAIGIPYDSDKEWFGGDESKIIPAFSKWCFAKVKEYGEGETFSSVSDIIDGIAEGKTGGAFLFGGHYEAYWLGSSVGQEAFPVNKEAWAEFCEIMVARDKDMLNLLKDTVPDMYNALIKVYKEVFG